ncbi:ATP-binding cassette domain-containing protein [Saccharothrix sp. S26]|uniref:ATP-binding cassette domain-containing protein n=1 Tax=Saccharothrix sp. S26 TaxID=2907215 RepID=UPI001F1AC3D2|nr:ATP-binding cassette domain-containing protein [Saccharothrix sp. S26]MCE7000446.1 ATP-binding cassette domain-containing protein [Saccharothrix sp. S26]
MTLLRMTGIGKVFPGVRTPDRVDLEVAEGEVHRLLGQNGAGKSTLIKVLAGAHQPDDGEITWRGAKTALPSPVAALRLGIATMYQELDLVPDLPVAENVVLGHEPARFGFTRRRAARDLARALMARLGHPEIGPDREVGRLSAAGQQLVSMARALARDARLIVMDEPTAAPAADEVDNLFRVTPLAYRLWIGGDNYRRGVNAGEYIAARMKAGNIADPIIGEVAGIDSLPLTQERSQGFRDASQRAGFSVGPRVSASFTSESGEQQTANLLQSAPELDALWDHDDDQGIGVMAAIDSAGREEFVMVGGAGSRNMMDLIKADSGVVKATVLYSPSMASSAIALARLLGQAKGIGDVAEHDIPASITTYSAVVTKENVDQYLDVGFDS